MIKPKPCKTCGHIPVYAKGLCGRCYVMDKAKSGKVSFGRKEIKKKTSKRLKEQLDDVFSLFIRLRDSDRNGMVKCFTCSKIDHWYEMQCGHYESRAHLGTRFDEKNSQTQCMQCNVLKKGNYTVYTRNIMQRYGANIIDLLAAKAKATTRFTPFEYKVLLCEYSDKVRELSTQKGIKLSKYQQKKLFNNI